MDRRALVAGVATGAVAFTLLHLTRPTPFDPITARLLQPGVADREDLRLIYTQVLAAARVGLACGFLVLVGAGAWDRRREQRIALAAVLGMTWILVVSFIQDLLRNLRADIASLEANAVWTVAFVLSVLSLMAFIIRHLTDGTESNADPEGTRRVG